MTDSEIIDALGGVSEVGDVLCMSRQVVHNWRQRGIPWLARILLAQIATTKGVKLPDDFLDRITYDKTQKRRKAKR